MLKIDNAMQRMVLNTFLKGHRDDLLEMVNNAVELVQGFDQRFQALESSISFLVEKQRDSNLKGELLVVLEDLKDGVSLDDALEDNLELPSSDPTAYYIGSVNARGEQDGK